jgi:hypothetical protein
MAGFKNIPFLKIKSMPSWMAAMFCICSLVSEGQEITGNILDSNSHQPLEGVTICVIPENLYGRSDVAGNFAVRCLKQPGFLFFTAIGYQSVMVSWAAFRANKNTVILSPATIELGTVTISPRPGEAFSTIGRIDITLRDINNAQEVLRLVPGLFIGQHQRGGKAEQIFLRGFEIMC